MPPVPVPLGAFFLREIGIGLGYRYTLAGIGDIEPATSPLALVQLLDSAASAPAYPPQPIAWAPTSGLVAYTVGLQALAKADAPGCTSRN